MSGYRIGLTGGMLDYAVKKYHGHRTIPAHLLNDLRQEYMNRK
jgi:hypothetical protein